MRQGAILLIVIGWLVTGCGLFEPPEARLMRTMQALQHIRAMQQQGMTGPPEAETLRRLDMLGARVDEFERRMKYVTDQLLDQMQLNRDHEHRLTDIESRAPR